MTPTKEPLVVIVGFLGAGKTTLLKKLVKDAIEADQKPFVILNDYQNASLDAQPLIEELGQEVVKTLNGSCICCTGLTELRERVNSIPQRTDGVTLIEANGTSDACALMEFLGVGINENFAPPIQLSVVSVADWQKRDSDKVQVSSMILLTHFEAQDPKRIEQVQEELKTLNPYAQIQLINELQYKDLFSLNVSQNSAKKMDHQKAHWSSCSIDLPDPMSRSALEAALKKIPPSILRVKGCTRLDDDEKYTFFERVPNQEIYLRPNRNRPFTGPKMIAVGPGSDPGLLSQLF
jgi:G3E family GTPase